MPVEKEQEKCQTRKFNDGFERAQSELTVTKLVNFLPS